MQFVIAFFLLLAIATNEWPSPLTVVSDAHRPWVVVSAQALLSGIACCGWGRWRHHSTWFPIVCWAIGSLIVTLGLGWSQWVAQHWGSIHSLSVLLILGPHLASLLFVWVVPGSLSMTGPSSGHCSGHSTNVARWRTIAWTQLRWRLQWQLLPIILPLATVLLARDVLELSSWWHQLTDNMQIVLLSAASMVVVLTVFPPVIKLWLPTRPFSDPEFQRQVDDAARKLGLNLRETAEWQTQRRIANALVLGWLPGTRRILISDVLSCVLTKPQRFAVFLHEAGHLKRHHLWWRLSVIVLAAQVFLLGSIATQREMSFTEINGSTEVFLASLGLLGLLLLTALLMGFVSRALEFEADGFALEHLQLAKSNESKISSTNGPEDLIAAIRCTAELTGIPLTKVTWMHPSISERIDRLKLCHASPVLYRVMCRRLRVLKIALTGALLLCAALLVLHGLIWNIP